VQGGDHYWGIHHATYNFVVAFAVNDLQDFLRLLRERPEWLGEARRVVLTDELLALPRELAEAIRQLTLRFEEAQQRNDDRFADIRGELLEIRYRNRIGAIFGGRLRKPRVVDGGDVWDMFRSRLDEGEIRRIVAADLIVRGGLLPAQGEGELWLVVEVSGVIDRNDVARAAERAALLRRAGLLVVPVAAGERLTQGAATLSGEFGVAIARNGGLDGWDKALANAQG